MIYNVSELRGNLNLLEEKQGYVRWLANKNELDFILDKLNVDFESIKNELYVKDGLYSIFIGRSTNREISKYLNMQFNGKHNESLFTSGISAFRKTIASIVCSNWACGEKTDEFLNKLKIEVNYVDFPVKSQEAMDELNTIIANCLDENLYILNFQGNNHRLADDIKNNLKELRKESKINAQNYFSSNNGEMELEKNRKIDDNMGFEKNRMWFITAGQGSKKYDIFKDKSFAAIGWDLGDLSDKNKDDIEVNYLEVYGKTKAKGMDVSQINRFVNEIKIGDYIITSNKSNRNYLIGKCVSDYFLSDELDDTNLDSQYKNCRYVEWVCEIGWEELNTEAKNIIKPTSVYEIKENVKNEFLTYFPSFMDVKRNIIYFGAPGTGKSFNLDQDKDVLLGNFKENYERVTFHPDYSYANFIGTYKPVPDDDSITYKYVPGPFMRILKKAIHKPCEPFLLIIEEINRANVAAVFGDVFQLLDRNSSNESEYSIDTSEDMKTYLNEDKIKLPSNLFIWATMNSADQGVFPMDTAFKRRWDFKYFSINYDEDLIDDTYTILNDETIYWNDLRKQINDELLSYKINEDKLMGPFFAFNEFMNEEIPTETFKDIFKNKIIMYLFEDAAKSKRNDLFSGARGNKNYVTYSEICEIFDEKGIEIFCDNIKNRFLDENEEY